MVNMKKALVFLFATTFLVGCFSAKLLTPTQTDVDRVASKYPNYTLTELNQGKSLFEANCGNCHGLKSPSSHTEAEWKEIVPRMSIKVNKKTPNSLDAESQEKILRYLITMSEIKAPSK